MVPAAFTPKLGKRRWLSALGGAVMLGCSLSLTPFAAAGESLWEPIPPGDLAATAPKDKSAPNAEVLLYRLGIATERGMFVQTQYLRVKVYTPVGIDEFQNVAIDDFGGERKDLGARVVHPDGSTREFTEKDFAKNNLAKINYRSLNEVRLMIPDLAPGDIVEARWELWRDSLPHWLSCQRSIPIRKFDFTLDANVFGIDVAWFQMAHPLVQATRSALHLQLSDLPAFVSEPDMPAKFECCATLLFSMGRGREKRSEGLTAFSRKLFDTMYRYGHASSALRAKAAELTAGTTSDEDKLRRLYEFCQIQVTNVDFDDAPASIEDRPDHNRARNAQLASDTLKLRHGRDYEINWLFAALASACGFETRLSASAERNEMGRVNISDAWKFMDFNSVAVKRGDHYDFFAPGDRFAPFGMLPWTKEGMQVVLGDRRAFVGAATSDSEPEKTRTVRKAHLRLDAAGELAGDVTEIIGGHRAIDWRMRDWNKSADELETIVRASVTKHLPNAELTAVRLENLHESEIPLVIHYHLRVPDFATATGSRLVFTPNIFSAGSSPRFTSPTRKYPVEFAFGQQFHDEIDIDLPEGYLPDSGDMPAPIDAVHGAIRQKTSIGYAHGDGQRYIHYVQDFSLGASGGTRIPAEQYTSLKRLFDVLHANAIHALVLKRTSATSAPAAQPDVTSAPVPQT